MQGDSVRLWYDIKWDSTPLKIAFPRIHALADNKGGVLQEFGRWENGKWRWEVKLRRPLFNWEVDQWSCFLLSLDSILIRKEFPDALAWSNRPNGLFSVGSFRNCIETSSNVDNSDFHSFPWQGISPPKVEVFVWQLIKGRVLVRNVLRRFGMDHMTSEECPLCNKGAETVDHLFLHCAWSWELWWNCMSWWLVNSCANLTVNDWLKGWKGLCPSANRQRVWNCLCLAVVWTIWEFRNNVVFNQKQPNLSLAMDSVKFRTVWWFKNFGPGSKDDINLLLLDVNARCTDKCPVKPPRCFSWSPPQNSDLFFNVDGSARGCPGLAGIGGVLRDNKSKILCLFSSHIGVSDSGSAEVHAIHMACNLIASNHLLADRNITIISDSKAAVSWVTGKDFGNLRLVNLLYDIRILLHSMKSLSIKFMPRGYNSLADSLAKSGSGLQGDRLEWDLS